MYYCISKKSRPILYSNLKYKMGQDFLDIQYNTCRAISASDLSLFVIARGKKSLEKSLQKNIMPIFLLNRQHSLAEPILFYPR